MSNTIRLTTAQALVRYLNQQYLSVDGEEFPFVKGVFHIFGHGNVLGIGEALEQDSGHLEIYQGKNEQGMAHAAIAFSKEKLRHEIFAVTTSVGPGAANLVTAAGTALANNIPVLFLPGDTFASRQPDPVLQQIEQENSVGITTNDCLKPVSRYWDRIQRPEQLMSALTRAFDILTDPEKAGPVTLALPQDVQGEAYDYPKSFFKKRVRFLDRRMPTKREVEGAIKRIQESRKPIIIVGGGARYSQSGDVIKKLSLNHKIPIVETQAGKSTIESDFPLNLGGVGITGTSCANQLLKQSDLVIGIGTRYTDFTTSSKTAFNTNVQFLNFNIARIHGSKLDGFSVQGDAKTSLEEVEQELALSYQTEWGSIIEQAKGSWHLECERLKQSQHLGDEITPEIMCHFDQNKLKLYEETLDTKLSQAAVVLKINDFLADNAIIVGAAGSLPGDLQRLWQSRSPLNYHLEYGYSTMGYEIAGAYGVKIANPTKDVYAIVGDGSFHMLHSEFLSSIQYGKKIIVLLFDNAGFGCINNLQMSSGMGSFGTEFLDLIGKPIVVDFAAIAKAYGGNGYSVRTEEELIYSLARAREDTVSSLIHIKVLPKTMTKNYDTWWNTGLAEVTHSEQAFLSLAEKNMKLSQALQY
ncbi:TPA: 3D-(3,5/4)-trihydroxycyclohexane-1,2-dione acylhydrolase (decyclizing) [Streptococcus suis]|nr:3D-(3,5/4)-trihydroxycyclohexane-1,2-dione acylhydrolase (decyclizing) [Streptococcus suis]HEM3649041.1 3D-(3,5/4)-trihydroxycyclohexane-1,2-dione acylhydrolase (decyclizing) [Streptococcus suis]